MEVACSSEGRLHNMTSQKISIKELVSICSICVMDDIKILQEHGELSEY
jgi:hypothetical protein